MRSTEIDGVLYRDEKMHKRAEWLARYAMPILHVRGEEHIQEITQLREDGKPVMIVANHISNADAFATKRALVKKGGREIEESLIWIYGIRLEGEAITKTLSDGFSRIRIFPSTVQADNEELKHTKHAMNTLAMEAAYEAITSGHIIGLFPEGTRSRNKHSAMNEAIPATAQFLELADDIYVAGVALEGTQRVIPVHRKIPRPARVTVAFTSPQRVVDIRNEVGALKGRPLRRAMWDAIMVPIAEELPEKMQGYYREKVAQKNGR